MDVTLLNNKCFSINLGTAVTKRDILIIMSIVIQPTNDTSSAPVLCPLSSVDPHRQTGKSGVSRLPLSVTDERVFFERVFEKRKNVIERKEKKIQEKLEEKERRERERESGAGSEREREREEKRERRRLMAGAQDQSGCSGSGGKEEKKKKYNTTLQKYLTDKLEETGEKERLTELLKERLIECGWRDELKVYCREKMAARAKKGSASLNVDALTREVIVHAQDKVPDSVKQEFLGKVREFVLKKD